MIFIDNIFRPRVVTGVRELSLPAKTVTFCKKLVIWRSAPPINDIYDLTIGAAGPVGPAGADGIDDADGVDGVTGVTDITYITETRTVSTIEPGAYEVLTARCPEGSFVTGGPCTSNEVNIVILQTEMYTDGIVKGYKCSFKNIRDAAIDSPFFKNGSVQKTVSDLYPTEKRTDP